MSQSAAANAPKLPKKEAELYRQVVNCYETKQYKKGIKHADTILKKFPTNSETLAMKGLLQNHLGNKEEAYDLVKTGIRNDVRSPVCWHVYGLLYKSDSNYKEAIKCYLNALRIEPNKENIMRDLSFLQMQMRDFQGFANTRRRLLELRPTIRASWVAFAVANYATHDYSLAHEVATKYFETRTEYADAYEESEFALFQVLCLEKLEKFDEAKTQLLANKTSIIDNLSYRIKLATLELYSGKFEESVAVWQQLLTEQPENFLFHRGLQSALLQLDCSLAQQMLSLPHQYLPCSVLPLTEAQVEKLLSTFYSTGQSPSGRKSRAFLKIRLFLLQFYPADDAAKEGLFLESLEHFISAGTNDGFPALGHDVLFLMTKKLDFFSGKNATFGTTNPMVIKSHFASFKLDAVDLRSHPILRHALRIIDHLLSRLRENDEFASSKSPQMELWLLYLKSHLLLKSGYLTDAMDAIQLAEAHTPTAIDIYTRKSRVFKLQGDTNSASQCMDQTRSLDLQDRYLNNKSTKYYLRNDQLQDAQDTIAMFTKHDFDNVDKTLIDLQVSWYELESGESAIRQKKFGLALRRFYSVKKHFQDQYDDLFDFHGYCYRKTTLKAYLDTLHNLDFYYSNKAYLRAMKGCLWVFGHLLDYPEDVDGLGHLSAADRKKERARLKKMKLSAAAKNETAPHSTDGNNNSNNNTSEAEKYEKEEETLLGKDFLQESIVWTQPLLSNDELLHAIDEESLAVLAEFAIRRGKYLLALRTINIALAKTPVYHPDITLVIVKLAAKVKAKKLAASASQLALTTLRTEIARILGGGESAGYLNEYLAHYLQFVAENPSILHTLSAVKCLQIVEKNAATLMEKVREMISRPTLLNADQCRGLTYKNLAELIKYLQGQFPSEAFVTDFVTRAAALFPRGNILQSSQQPPLSAASAASGVEESNGHSNQERGEGFFVTGLGSSEAP